MPDFTNVVEINPNAARAPSGVYLPTPRVADFRAGQEQISTPQIQQQSDTSLRELAGTLAKSSDEANQVAQLFAKQAGYQAVTRDAEGNLVVAKAPIVGDAAVAYHSAVKYTALSLGESEAKQGDIALSQKYQNDPDGYLEAAQSFRNKKVQEFSQVVGPDVGVALGSTIDETTAQSYKFLVRQNQARIASDFDAATKANMESTKQDLLSLLASGGAGTPEAQKLVNKYIGIQKQRIDNPVLGEPAAVGALNLKKFDMEVGGATFQSGINRILKDPNGGVQAAMQAVESVKNDGSMSPAQRIYNYTQGQDTIKEYLQNQQRKAVLDEKAQKNRDNAFETQVIQDSATGNPQITENDIKTAPGISPESKMRMLAWQKRDGMPEPMARVSQTNATDLFRKMNLPDDDPQHINSLSPIRTAYVNGQLTRTDEQWLEQRFLEGRSPDGGQLNKLRTDLSKAAAPMLDKSTLMNIDGEGKLRTYAFERFVDQKIGEYRQAGKNPIDLFDPSKPDFLGKPDVINSFNAPLQTQIHNRMRTMQGGGGGAPAPAIAPRQPGEGVADYMKRTGKGLP